jgi:hypothetical protein
MDEKQQDQARKQAQPEKDLDNKGAGHPHEHNAVEKGWENEHETEDPNMNPG